MAVQTVKATINGQTYTLAYNGTSGKYEATLTAPTITSYNKIGGYYGVSVDVTDEAGNITTQTETNTDNRLVVKEIVAPVISNISPSQDARVTTSSPTITGTLLDETNGSGVNTATFVLKIDGVAVSNASVTFTPIANGYNFSCPATGLSQGTHTFTVELSDNDGNAATLKSTSVIVDTIAPSLSVSNPTNGYITNTAAINVTGITSDETSNPITVTIKLNGVDQGLISLSAGAFSKGIALAGGSNSIEVKATDDAGLATTVTRTLTLDTVAPVITSIELVPNPIDAGATYIIKVTATD